MTLNKPDGLVGSLGISFHWNTFLPIGLGPFYRTLHMSVVVCKPPCGVHIFIFKASHECWDTLFNLS